MGVWLSLNRNCFNKSKKLFAITGKIGVSAHCYSDALRRMLSDKHDVIMGYGMDPKRTKPYGLRKGSGTSACSSSTAAPSLPSVANRGEWSQGTVFNVYLQFAEPGDHYLGRLLALFDPHDPLFSTVCPHFTEGLEDDDVFEFIMMCFGDLVTNMVNENETNCISCLMFFGASLAYHSNEFKAVAAGYTDHGNHLFGTLPMFSEPDLLERVKQKLTIGKSDFVRVATGIPPHVKVMDQLDDIHGRLSDVNEKLASVTDKISDSVRKGIESNDLRSSQLTLTTLEEGMSKFKTQLMNEISQKLDACHTFKDRTMGSELPEFEVNDHPTLDLSVATTAKDAKKDRGLFKKYYVYNHPDGIFYDVPHHFKFPTSTNRVNGWNLWVLGQPSYEYIASNGDKVRAPIRPFHLMQADRLPKNLKSTFRTNWKVVFKLMQGDTPMVPPEKGSISEFLSSTFASGTERIKARATYILNPNFKSNTTKWTISYWARSLSKAQIAINTEKVMALAEKQDTTTVGNTAVVTSPVAQLASTSTSAASASTAAARKRTLNPRGNSKKEKPVKTSNIGKKKANAKMNKPLARVTGQKRKTTTTTKKQTRSERQRNVLDGFGDAFCHVAPPPTKISRNAAGQWLPMPCEEKRNGCTGIPSSHRCMVKVAEGGCYENDPNDRICGKVFCLICAAARGLPHNTLKCHHHFPGNPSNP